MLVLDHFNSLHILPDTCYLELSWPAFLCLGL